jgi:hypothetical protein
MSMITRNLVLSRIGWGLGVAAVAASLAVVVAAADPPASPSAMRRLTDEQYRNAITDIFGEDIEYAGRFDPVLRPTHGLQIQGVSQIAVSPAGFEQYDKVGRAIAAQVVDERHRTLLVGCTPKSATLPDDACAATFYRRAGELLFRRPLTPPEVQVYVTAAREATTLRNDFHGGLADGLGMMLGSPRFLFDIDVTEPDPTRPGALRLDAYSKASRLSFFLWNTTPDRELLAAAAKRTLHTPDGLTQQVNRLLESPRLESGVRMFFADMLGFEQIADLSKDGVIYPQFTANAKRDMSEQTLRTIVDLLVTNDGDYRDLFTTRRTFLTRALGAIYRVPVPEQHGWIPYEFPEDSPRAGLLSQPSFVATFSHPGRSSPTLRGKAFRELILCQPVPDPPPNVDFSQVENTTQGTVRTRLTAHRVNPGCAGCHRFIDPVGLTLENFDGAGAYRLAENGEAIDVDGELDGSKFTGPAGLGQVVRNHPALPMCLSKRLFEYAVRRPLDAGEAAWVKGLSTRFVEGQYRLRELLRIVATSEQFFTVPGATATSSNAAAISSRSSREVQ